MLGEGTQKALYGIYCGPGPWLASDVRNHNGLVTGGKKTLIPHTGTQQNQEDACYLEVQTSYLWFGLVLEGCRMLYEG